MEFLYGLPKKVDPYCHEGSGTPVRKFPILTFSGQSDNPSVRKTPTDKNIERCILLLIYNTLKYFLNENSTLFSYYRLSFNYQVEWGAAFRRWPSELKPVMLCINCIGGMVHFWNCIGEMQLLIPLDNKKIGFSLNLCIYKVPYSVFIL